MNNLLNIPENEATFTVYNYAKIYPEHVNTYILKSPFQKTKPDYQLQTKAKKSPTDPTKPKICYTIDNTGNFINMNTGAIANFEKQKIIERSLRRSKTVVSDLIACNDFKWFGTFTFDPSKYNRQDPLAIKKVMFNWLTNQKKIHGNFNYILVPEFHKDGKSLHFHALIGSNYNGKFIDSGKKWHDRTIYNLKSFKAGLTNFTEIESKGKTANYVTKYLTKDMPQFDGKKRYWSSQGLKRPQLDYNSEILDNPFIENLKLHENKLFTKYKSSVTIEKQI